MRYAQNNVMANVRRERLKSLCWTALITIIGLIAVAFVGALMFAWAINRAFPVLP